ncbi:efflux RND transporter periplasmic adaptor subunit [Shewanella maritima]|uniref:efflux RND transporter periplasmic adaptor subunit n=1 Tax=Shewanella maritima TaxID=2520507 RepID=UPI003736BBDE
MNTKKRLVIPGIAAGVLILILAIVLKPSPKLVAEYNNARLVEVLTLQPKPASPTIQGFGRVSPKHVWQALAEVSGEVIYRHPQLETGRILPQGTLLLSIDPLEYELKLAQAQASLNSTEAQLVKLDQQESSLQRSLEIEQQKLELSEQEYQRKLTLKKQNLVSSSDLESQKQTLLAQTNVVEDLQNSLKVLPDDRNVTLAQKQVDIAQLKDAERRLDQTQIILPFNARLSDVNIEQNQVVANGEVMLIAHQLGTAEIKAELSIQDMRKLVQSLSYMAKDEQNMPSIELFDLNASIIFSAGSNRFEWPAKVTRVAETVNPNQGTIGVFLEVEQDFTQLDILTRPPLTNGMFVKALIHGHQTEQFSVPERALHSEQLYVMDGDNKLKIVPVDVLFRHEDGVAVSGDIIAGDRVIINDLIPAIDGMALRLEQAAQDNSGVSQ